MNVDFLLFSAPKTKFTFLEMWGEVIFIPRIGSKKSKPQTSLFGSLFKCYSVDSVNDAHSTLHFSGKEFLKCESAISESNTETTVDDEEIEKHIPCLFLNSNVHSRYLLIYFHASGEDIKLTRKFMDHLRNLYQINVLAMEYPGYLVYKGSPDAKVINNDAQYVYEYCVKKLGFQEDHIILVGRSIGTGVTLELASKTCPRAIALISPFVGVKQLANDLTGFLGHIVQDSFDNLDRIQRVKCPVFIAHGKADTLIAHKHAETLASYARHCKLNISNTMTHSQLDFYMDFSEPLRQFLMEEGINFYDQVINERELPDWLFQPPQGLR